MLSLVKSNLWKRFLLVDEILLLRYDTIMNTITSQKRYQENDVVIIPRQEYEYLIKFKKIKEFLPTLAQKKALASAENNFKKRKTLSYDKVAQKLGFAN